MGWFTSIDSDLLDWEMSHWKWLIRNLRPFFDLDLFTLITPTPTHFPIARGTPEETGLATFLCIKKYFQVENWPCRLEPYEEADDVARSMAPVCARPERTKGSAGLFEVTPSKEVIIRYKIAQLADPMSLIATMAHELSHYVAATIQEPPPTGWEDHEPITDLIAVFFGFGIFLANSTFRFTQWQDNQHQGWSAQRQGYLSEKALALALAIFWCWGTF